MTSLKSLPTWRHLGDLCVNVPKGRRSRIPTSLLACQRRWVSGAQQSKVCLLQCLDVPAVFHGVTRPVSGTKRRGCSRGRLYRVSPIRDQQEDQSQQQIAEKFSRPCRKNTECSSTGKHKKNRSGSRKMSRRSRKHDCKCCRWIEADQDLESANSEQAQAKQEMAIWVAEQTVAEISIGYSPATSCGISGCACKLS